MPASAWNVPCHRDWKDVPHLFPNHDHKNRSESICRESGVNIFQRAIPDFIRCTGESASKPESNQATSFALIEWSRSFRKTSFHFSGFCSVEGLVAGDDELDRDQNDDDDFQPQRSPGIDNVGENFRGAAHIRLKDDVELLDFAFLQLIVELVERDQTA